MSLLSRPADASPPSRRSLLVAAGLALVAAVASTLLLAWLLADGGARMSPDSRKYLGAAANWLRGEGLTSYQYFPGQGLSVEPLVDFPPLTSLVYASTITLGVAPDHTPTVIALAMWPLLLLGVWLLARRLCGAPAVAATAVWLVAVAQPALYTYEYALSEAVFAPLLVGLMALLSHPPRRDHPEYARLAGTAGLLVLLTMSRYAGAFVGLGVAGWWAFWRLRQRAYKRLLAEGAVLALAALPLLLWMARNAATTGAAGGRHLGPSVNPFWQGPFAAARESALLLLPSVRPYQVRNVFGYAGLSLYLPLLGGACYLLWRARPSWQKVWSSPVLPFLLAYYAALTLAQPFTRIPPFTMRLVVPVLVAGIPWGLSFLEGAPRRPLHACLPGAVALNVSLVALFIVLGSITMTGEARLAKLDDPAATQTATQTGVPMWLISGAMRAEELRQRFPALYQYLRRNSRSQRPVILTNAHLLLSPHQSLGFFGSVRHWLDDGTCSMKRPTLLTLFERGRRSSSKASRRYRRLRRQVQRKCPDVRRKSFPRSTVFHLKRRSASPSTSLNFPDRAPQDRGD